ncbi:MAG: tRNA (adenosine(37)-N6)-threonylcarbamoyltransferase complex ATPase subunit type 1 TsaE [Pelagibacterales bacterium]|nr:tRNA (adenosine(37)-N6)-threonylcarbamoyltransferase complex ATPase subunit type 1 TsaE [Pelagibacterales bacterium]
MDLKDLNETKKIARKFIKFLEQGDIVLLQGDLGSGKTTFSRFLINQLQSKNKLSMSEVTSPTFNIVNYYEVKKNNLQVAHYDFYRIKKFKELENIGFLDQIQNFVSIIEWPNLIMKAIDQYLVISFFLNSKTDERKIKFKGTGKWSQILKNEFK